ncbi:MAG: hypothetical protein IPM11_00645 [Micropruina sp.]|nr:hypothetical protein [Micropruina sp.]
MTRDESRASTLDEPRATTRDESRATTLDEPRATTRDESRTCSQTPAGESMMMSDAPDVMAASSSA